MKPIQIYLKEDNLTDYIAKMRQDGASNADMSKWVDKQMEKPGNIMQKYASNTVKGNEPGVLGNSKFVWDFFTKLDANERAAAMRLRNGVKQVNAKFTKKGVDLSPWDVPNPYTWAKVGIGVPAALLAAWGAYMLYKYIRRSMGPCKKSKSEKEFKACIDKARMMAFNQTSKSLKQRSNMAQDPTSRDHFASLAVEYDRRAIKLNQRMR